MYHVVKKMSVLFVLTFSYFLLFVQIYCSLPEDMAFLRNLTKLYVYKNFIEELPEVRSCSITVVVNLFVNDFIHQTQFNVSHPSLNALITVSSCCFSG